MKLLERFTDGRGDVVESYLTDDGEVLRVAVLDVDGWKAEQKRRREQRDLRMAQHKANDIEHVGTLPAAMFAQAVLDGSIHDSKWLLKTMEANPELKLTEKKLI